MQCLLLQVPDTGVRDSIKGLIPEYPQQWFVIHSNDQVWTAKYEESCLVHCIGYCQGFTLNRRIPRFSRVREPAAHQSDAPTVTTAEWLNIDAAAVFLEQPESDASLGPICSKACRFSLIKDADTMLNLVHNLELRFHEEGVHILIPVERGIRLQESTKWGHPLIHTEGIADLID